MKVRHFILLVLAAILLAFGALAVRAIAGNGPLSVWLLRIRFNGAAVRSGTGGCGCDQAWLRLVE